VNLDDLKKKPVEDLLQIAEDINLENAPNMLRQELIFEILKATSQRNGQIYGQGVLEILPDGFGFYVLQTITIYQVLMTYTCHPLR